MVKLLTIITLHTDLVKYSSSFCTSYTTTYRVILSCILIATVFILLECWILEILGLSSTKILKNPSTCTHRPLSFRLLVSLIYTALQSDLSLFLINISFLHSLLMCLKRALQLLFSHRRKILRFFNCNNYVIKSYCQRTQYFYNDILLCIVSPHAFTWFTNRVILIVKLLMASFFPFESIQPIFCEFVTSQPSPYHPSHTPSPRFLTFVSMIHNDQPFQSCQHPHIIDQKQRLEIFRLFLLMFRSLCICCTFYKCSYLILDHLKNILIFKITPSFVCTTCRNSSHRKLGDLHGFFHLRQKSWLCTRCLMDRTRIFMPKVGTSNHKVG